MILEILFVLYVLFTIFICIGAGFMTAFECDNETNIFRKAFYVQRWLWRNSEEDINIAGRIIILICGTLFVWPLNMICFGIWLIIWIAKFLWAMFCFIFAKKTKEEHNDQT